MFVLSRWVGGMWENKASSCVFKPRVYSSALTSYQPSSHKSTDPNKLQSLKRTFLLLLTNLHAVTFSWSGYFVFIFIFIFICFWLDSLILGTENGFYEWEEPHIEADLNHYDHAHHTKHIWSLSCHFLFLFYLEPKHVKFRFLCHLFQVLCILMDVLIFKSQKNLRNWIRITKKLHLWFNNVTASTNKLWRSSFFSSKYITEY